MQGTVGAGTQVGLGDSLYPIGSVSRLRGGVRGDMLSGKKQGGGDL